MYPFNKSKYIQGAQRALLLLNTNEAQDYGYVYTVDFCLIEET